VTRGPAVAPLFPYTTLFRSLQSALLPDELAHARDAISALPAIFTAHLDRALADELPLLKRDGGFVRAGYNAELDEMRALRDQSRDRKSTRLNSSHVKISYAV